MAFASAEAGSDELMKYIDCMFGSMLLSALNSSIELRVDKEGEL